MPLSSSAVRALAAALFFVSPLAAVPFTVEGPNVDPADFRVTKFADGLDFPLGMAELPDGSILALVNIGSSFSASTGRLLRFVDEDGDGAADRSTIAYNTLPGGQTAVEVGGALVFVTGRSLPLTVLRMPDSLEDPFQFVGKIDFLYSTPSAYHVHSTLELRETPGAANSYDLFFQIGSEHNYAPSTRTVDLLSEDVAGVTGTLEGAAAYMMTIVDEGSLVRMQSVKQIGTGLRNPAGFAVHPTTGDLYFQDNGIDGLVDVNEPHSADEINFIAREEIAQTPVPDFGFPNNYIAYRTREIVGGEGLQPIIAFQPIPDPMTGLRAEGPNDIVFAPPGFPAGLNRGLFIGFHGKYNLGGLANDENPLVYADPETGDYFHFIRGQQQGIGHLDGLLATRDSLFVADFATGGSVGNAKGEGVIYQIKSLVPPTPPDLVVRHAGSLIELTWDRGILQRSSQPNGPWETMTDVFSPLLIEPAAAREFYRAAY